MDVKQEFVNYCNENWDLPAYEVDKALDAMGEMRCPLDFANDAVTNYIKRLSEDFAFDNDLDIDWIDDYDIEEIFWEIDL